MIPCSTARSRACAALIRMIAATPSVPSALANRMTCMQSISWKIASIYQTHMELTIIVEFTQYPSSTAKQTSVSRRGLRITTPFTSNFNADLNIAVPGHNAISSPLLRVTKWVADGDDMFSDIFDLLVRCACRLVEREWNAMTKLLYWMCINDVTSP